MREDIRVIRSIDGQFAFELSPCGGYCRNLVSDDSYQNWTKLHVEGEESWLKTALLGKTLKSFGKKVFVNILK